MVSHFSIFSPLSQLVPAFSGWQWRYICSINSPQKQGRHPIKRPAIVVPETQSSDSTDGGNVPEYVRPKKKQVHFRTPSTTSTKASTSSDETELPMIQLTQSAQPTTKYLSLYSSSDTETDIPNAQAQAQADEDKYLIYKWECSELGGKASYVFKTSEMSLNIAAKIGGKIRIGTEDSSLIDEAAYFDGMHKRVKDFVTLTLWVFHPGMRAMQILGAMECTNENAASIEIFFNTFNKTMGDYLGEEDYVWDPYLLMMDEKGANFEAVARVFGKNFRQTKTVTCQFHFFHCTESYIRDVPTEERITFRTLCRQLCEAHTIDRYRKISEKIIAIAEKYGFTGWWKFWSLCSHTCFVWV